MKKIAIIINVILIVILAIFFFLIRKNIPNDAKIYIQTKKDSLHTQAIRQVDALFNNKRGIEVFPLYNNCQPRFIKDNGPTHRFTYSDNMIKEPNDVCTKYYFSPKNTGWRHVDGVWGFVRFEMDDEPIKGVDWDGIWQSGWALGVRENFGCGDVAEYMVIPFAVFYRKQQYGSAEDFYNVNKALCDTYDFYTKSPESSYNKYFVKNVANIRQQPMIKNEYYYLKRDTTNSYFVSRFKPRPYTRYMYNNFVYVYITSVGDTMYELELNTDYVKFDKQQFIQKKTADLVNRAIVGGSVLSLTLLFLVVFCIKERSASKMSLLQRVVKVSNPRKYVASYDEHKLQCANDVYSHAIVTAEDDTAAILTLATKVEEGLGINLITKGDIYKLKKLCSPKRFMKPYNAEKVTRANALYSQLVKERISVKEYYRIKEEAESLLQ